MVDYTTKIKDYFSNKQDLTNSYNITGKLGAKNLLVYPYYDGNSKSSNGIDFEVDSEGVITFGGSPSSSEWAQYFISFATLTPGKYTLSIEDDFNTTGVNVTIDSMGESSSRLCTLNRNRRQDTFEVVVETYVRIAIVCNPSYSYSNVILHPMLRYAEDTDNTWQSYAKTNRELTRIVNFVEPEVQRKQNTIQYTELPTAEESNLKAIVQYVGITTSERINSHMYQCVKVPNGYDWKDITEVPVNYWGSIVDYPSYVYNQDKFDDMLVKKTGMMLRTDTLVPNQATFGLNAGNGKEVSSGQTLGYNCAGYKYFYWYQVEPTHNNYDFSSIENYLKAEYSKKRRSGLRLFVNTASPQQDNTYTIEGTTYHSLCPQYIVEMMHASTKPKYYYQDNYILTDWNEEDIRTAFKNLIVAFGTWYSNSSFTDDNSETIYYKDLISYIDMGIMGPWGEGQRYTWQFNECTVEDMVSIYQQYLTSLPNTQCNIGQCNNSYSVENGGKDGKVFTTVKELSNNAGYVGFFLDNVGSNNRIYRDDFYIDENNNSLVPYLEKYGNRGDFFTGEFAGWVHETASHGNSGAYALKTFKLLKAPHFRLSNMTSQGEDISYRVNTLDKKVYLEYIRALSCVGSRFVLTPISYITSNNKLQFRIVNIGLTAPYFDYYTVKIRVRNLDVDEYFDVSTNIDLTSISPLNEPLLYILSNGEACNITLPAISYTNYTISIIGIDKMGFEPMYFSNYDRNTDGSYLLFTVNNTTVTSVLQDVENLTDKIFNMTNEAIQNDVGTCLKAHNDIESETIAQNWTLLYTNKVYKKDTNSYEDIPGASGYARTYAMECEAFDKLEALSWNGQINASIGDSIVFFNKDDKAVGIYRFSSNDGTAQGEQIEAPLGTVKVCFTCFNTAETMAANRVKVVKAVLVPKNTVKLSDLKTVAAASSDFSDFQTRIAAL